MKLSVVVPVAVSLAIAVALLAPRPAPAAGKEYKVVEVKDGGKIHGFAKLKEKVERKKVSVFKDNEKGCGDKEHMSERLVFDDASLGVGNVLVFLKSIDAGKEWPAAMKSDDRTATIDQKGCQYLPHAQWARAGTQVVVLNSDRADHNIHGFKSAIEKSSLADTKFNFSSEPDTKKDAIGDAFLEDAAKYVIKCDIHPWMNAYVFVVDHPYYDLTVAADADGRKAGEFTLADVPAGEYELIWWKEGVKETAQEQDGKISAYNYGPDQMPEAPIKVKVEAGKTVEIPDIAIDGTGK